MKRIAALIGIGLLCAPLLRHVDFNNRLEASDSAVEVVSNLSGVFTGLMVGFSGLMLLGFVVDGGSGYRRPTLLISMALLGVVWLMFYPSGWMLGAPLIIYSLSRKLGFGASSLGNANYESKK